MTYTFDIFVFEPLLNVTFYAHTYKGFESEIAAKEWFVRVNPHHDFEHVTVREVV
jgi:hypothetical protein